MAFLQSEPRTRIELSRQEMLAISHAINSEFAPRFTKHNTVCARSMTFSVQELLTISQEISREFAPRTVENSSRLVLLPVDPQRLHAYWHLAENNLNPSPKLAGEDRLTLRVFKQADHPSPGTTNVTDQPPHWFDIAIDKSQNRQEIVVPVDSGFADAKFCAAIGESHGKQGFTVLAYSNSADIPSPRLSRDGAELSVALAQFIMPAMKASSSRGKAAPIEQNKDSR
jgi:hypothetical protein